MDNNFKLVNYSEKSVALLIERDGAITEELTDIGGRYNYRLSCGPGWIFSRKKSFDALIGLLNCYEIGYKLYELDELPTVNEPGNKENNNISPDWILTDQERKEWAQNVMGDMDYYKSYNVAVKLSGGEIVPISKPDLKTEFWHHDEGTGYDEHCRITESEQSKRDYFISENTSKFRDIITGLMEPDKLTSSYKYLWLGNWHKDGRNQWTLKWLNISPDSINCRQAIGWHETQLQSMYDKGMFKPLNDDDKARVLMAYKIALEAIEKRCNAYLKRYGTDKLSFRTYWADR